ncbi:MAG: hypothetical protein WAZ99_03580 [Rectinemataceae bacterium]
MKKFTLIAIFAVLGAVSVFAASTSTINIVATVGSTLSLTSTVPTTAINLDVVGGSSTSLGNITVFSNSPGNWKITVHSVNGGKMVGETVGNTGVYPYLFVFGTEGAKDLASDYVLAKTGTTGSSGITYALSITYANYATLNPTVQADTYSDTITVTIETN